VSCSELQKALVVSGGVDDPNDLTETGLAVLFASDTDPAIK